ncbi:MAG: hypothetical protein JW839_21210 [Candidatus Lokiarchaeota archaeon]|nr:hypothetical protein [Candidatus Lokiarchaeota archaeon]
MEWLKKNVWILLLSGAIITIVALLTPAAVGYFPPNTVYIWLWALNVRSTGQVWYNLDEIAVAGAVLETGVLVAAAVLLTVLAIVLKKGRVARGMYGVMLACLIMLVASPLGYVAGAVAWNPWFWAEHVAGFGIIGPLVAAGLVILSFLMLRKS